MLLLENLTLYAIKADMYVLNPNDENDFDYTEPVYFCIDTETKDKSGNVINLITLESDLNNPKLRVFQFKVYAKEYIYNRNYSNITNMRVITIKYDFQNNKWVENES